MAQAAGGGSSRATGVGVAAGGAAWFMLYLLVTVGPLLVAVTANPPPGRDLWTEISVGLGFVGLSMLGLQFAVVSRFSAVNAPFGLDAVLQFHREISYVAMVFVLAHPTIIFVTQPEMLEVLNLVEADWQARFGVLSVAALLVLVATSIWRRRLRLRYEVWRVLHGSLAAVVVVAALAHIEQVGYYVDGFWKRSLWIVMSAAFVTLLVNVYVVQPWRERRRPWEVTSVTPARGSSWTVELRPVGHDGLRFAPGQFAWVTFGRSPFAVREHPFSIASSAEEPGAVQFAIAEAGDFTSTVGDLEPGTRAYLDGPYGVFSYERHEGPRFVFVVGGIGIAPVLSMLRTLADRQDARPCLVVLGNPTWEEVPYREELEELRGRLDLTVVHVLEDAPEGWEGETGFIDGDVLDRHLGEGYERSRYFLCGPVPMTDAVQAALAERGVPTDHVHLELFELV
ncbi:ferric reductase-like transmembrane domain-containing protein [Actinotalea sp. BY-33]|uniref:Ferric reductase-like transmembrane domain-containing protein n=1 Tax=Actinotalea soli TaxID=2819234 RepID=A0A939RTT9_9CELL|nr:ferric reductase-like transmembrane domain-containing protein [Actinotalea soli]MBO1751734.1 ferric reductase-like transmembrane domain-containing protein [Actinotalea soli]